MTTKRRPKHFVFVSGLQSWAEIKPSEAVKLIEDAQTRGIKHEQSERGEFSPCVFHYFSEK